jgi:hypothetical protein
MQYTYTKTPVSVDRLTQEIVQSSITIALNSITAFGVEITVGFKASLSESEKSILDVIISAHSGEPLPDHDQQMAITALPEAKPFASPDYRTKRDSTAFISTIEAGSSVNLDYILPETRYVSGGSLIVKNAQFGDYISASVVDVNGVIPQAYRASLCENWPIVSTYICREWVEVSDGVHTKHRVDTYPLNAKITQGLFLRITYNATNSGNTREACVNYNLTKKLI